MHRTIELIMTSKPISVNHLDSIQFVINQMDKYALSNILVSKNETEIVGVISRKDVISYSKNLLSDSSGSKYNLIKLSTVSAAEIMSKNVITINASDDIAYATELLLQKQFHCLPVIDDGKLVGIVTMFDVLKSYYEEHENCSTDCIKCQVK